MCNNIEPCRRSAYCQISLNQYIRTSTDRIGGAVGRDACIVKADVTTCITNVVWEGTLGEVHASDADACASRHFVALVMHNSQFIG